MAKTVWDSYVELKEKLVELVHNARMNALWHNAQKPDEYITDMLMEDGVTVQDNTEISDELLELLRKAPVTVMTEEPTVEVVQEWISVKEQEQPTEYGTYLCHGYWLSSRRKKTETAEFFGEWNLANNFILTHWMPLPEPPKEV